jgi:hypothetical protein
MAREGHDSNQIAAVLNRKPDSIRHLCTLHGISLPSARTDKWTNDDLNALSDLHAVGLPVPAMASKLNRTIAAVSHMLGKLGLSTAREAASVVLYFRLAKNAYDRLCDLALGFNSRPTTMLRVLAERVLGNEDLLESVLDGDEEGTSRALRAEQHSMPMHSLGAAVSNEPIPFAEMSRRYLGGHFQPAPTFVFCAACD